jgi:hypothetical protein
MKYLRKLINSLWFLPGLLVSLFLIASMALTLYLFFDWHFMFVTVPVGCVAAMLVAGAANWWSEHR